MIMPDGEQVHNNWVGSQSWGNADMNAIDTDKGIRPGNNLTAVLYRIITKALDLEGLRFMQ